MISNAASTTTSPRTKPASLLCALAAMMLLSSLPTGCASASSAPEASLAIYQPRVLRLAKGRPVPTAAGVYTPQADEVWHSAAAYQAIETQLLNTAAALAQAQNRK